jgi:hypothetical protein
MGMAKMRRIDLDWRKLFAFQQVDVEQRATRAPHIDTRLGAKIGDKGCRVPAPPE